MDLFMGHKNAIPRNPVFRLATVRHSSNVVGRGADRVEKYSHLYEQFATYDNLYDGYLLARENKRFREGVLDYSAHLEEYIIEDVNRLQWMTYSPGPMGEFMEYFPKKRIICYQPFRDRVINCAAYNVLWPIYSKSFYEHSYGSIPGRGPLLGVQKLQSWMQHLENSPKDWTIGKLDIAKFFFRVPVDVQLRELGRPLADPKMMWFLETAIRCDGRAFGLPLECPDVELAERVPGIGMQVGSLISQMTANVVLTPLDHYIKRVLKVPYYIRYMDDMVIIAPSRSECKDAINEIDSFLRSRLGLQLNNKTQVKSIGNRIEFIGMMVAPHQIHIRKSTTLQMKRKLEYCKQKYADNKKDFRYVHSVYESYQGMLKHTDSTNLSQKLMEDFVLVKHKPEEYKEDDW